MSLRFDGMVAAEAGIVAFQIATYTLPSVELPRYVREESDIVWYPVTGSSVRDLQSQMRANGPRDDAGAFAGYTHNNTYWHIMWREGGGSCSVTNVAVATYDTVTLPMWSPPPHADSALAAEWSRFGTALEDVASPPPPLALVVGVAVIVILVPGIVYLRRARAQ
jgi:predicted secreted Zn-dependent protease